MDVIFVPRIWSLFEPFQLLNGGCGFDVEIKLQLRWTLERGREEGRKEADFVRG
jgi:hypothetical protein